MPPSRGGGGREALPESANRSGEQGRGGDSSASPTPGETPPTVAGVLKANAEVAAINMSLVSGATEALADHGERHPECDCEWAADLSAALMVLRGGPSKPEPEGGRR